MTKIQTMHVGGIKYHVTEKFNDITIPERYHYLLRRLNGRRLWHVTQHNGTLSNPQAVTSKQYDKLKQIHCPVRSQKENE